MAGGGRKETETAISLVTILLRLLILYEDSSLMTWFWSWPEQNLNIFQKLISKYCHLGIRAWIYGWRDNIEYIISFNSKSHRLWREGPQRKTKQIIFNNWKRIMFSFLPRSLSVQSLSHVRLSATPWIAARQASLTQWGTPQTHCWDYSKSWKKVGIIISWAVKKVQWNQYQECSVLILVHLREKKQKT